MKLRIFSKRFLNFRQTVCWGGFAFLTLAVLGGCRTPQPEVELQRENQALERQIYENYAFMQHQQRRITELETKLTQNDGKPAPSPSGSLSASASSSESGAAVNVSAVSKPTTSASTSGVSSNGPRWRDPNSGEPAPSANSGSASGGEQRGSLLDGIQADPTARPSVTIPEGAKPSATIPKGLFDHSATPGAGGGNANPGAGQSGNNQTALPTDLQPTAQLREAQPEEVAQIAIDPTQIGPLQIDFNQQKEGLRFVLNCQTEQGETVTTASQAEIVVIDPLLPGDAARVARWNVAPNQMENRIQLTPQPDGVLFELAWPQNRKPQNNQLDVFVRLTDNTGRRVQTQQKVDLSSPQFSLWQNIAPQNSAQQNTFANNEQSLSEANLPSDGAAQNEAAANGNAANEAGLAANSSDNIQTNIQAPGEDLPAAQTRVSKSEITVAAPQIDGLIGSYQAQIAQNRQNAANTNSASSVASSPVSSATVQLGPPIQAVQTAQTAQNNQTVRNNQTNPAGTTGGMTPGAQDSGYVQQVQAVVPLETATAPATPYSNSASEQRLNPSARSTTGIPTWSPYR